MIPYQVVVVWFSCYKVVFLSSFVSKQAQADCTTSRCISEETSLRFNIIGDFGGQDDWPYVTLTQDLVAGSLGTMAARWQTQFQLALGDNLYEKGVDRPDSHRFKDSFENVYVRKSLNTPWYIIAGNHDHQGNASAQVEYTKFSKKCADYLFVVGHYPVYSVSHNGPSQCLIDRLLPLLNTYRVSAYIAGHDHSLQHLKTIGNDWTLHHIISGMGAESRNSTKHKKDVPEGSLIFHHPSNPQPILTDGGYVVGKLTLTKGVYFTKSYLLF